MHTYIHTHAQFGFISFFGEGRKQDSVFFHMNSLMSGCDFSDLRSGDEVEFMLSFNQNTKKRSAIHVRRLRYVCVCVCVHVCMCVCVYALIHFVCCIQSVITLPHQFSASVRPDRLIRKGSTPKALAAA